MLLLDLEAPLEEDFDAPPLDALLDEEDDPLEADLLLLLEAPLEEDFDAPLEALLPLEADLLLDFAALPLEADFFAGAAFLAAPLEADLLLLLEAPLFEADDLEELFEAPFEEDFEAPLELLFDAPLDADLLAAFFAVAMVFEFNG